MRAVTQLFLRASIVMVSVSPVDTGAFAASIASAAAVSSLTASVASGDVLGLVLGEVDGFGVAEGSVLVVAAAGDVVGCTSGATCFGV